MYAGSAKLIRSHFACEAMPLAACPLGPHVGPVWDTDLPQRAVGRPHPSARARPDPRWIRLHRPLFQLSNAPPTMCTGQVLSEIQYISLSCPTTILAVPRLAVGSSAAERA